MLSINSFTKLQNTNFHITFPYFECRNFKSTKQDILQILDVWRAEGFKALPACQFVLCWEMMITEIPFFPSIDSLWKINIRIILFIKDNMVYQTNKFLKWVSTTNSLLNAWGRQLFNENIPMDFYSIPFCHLLPLGLCFFFGPALMKLFLLPALMEFALLWGGWIIEIKCKHGEAEQQVFSLMILSHIFF